MRHTVLNEWRVDDTIIHELVVTYTRHDGSQVAIPATTIYRLTGDLVSEYQIYIDLAPLST